LLRESSKQCSAAALEKVGLHPQPPRGYVGAEAASTPLRTLESAIIFSRVLLMITRPLPLTVGLGLLMLLLSIGGGNARGDDGAIDMQRVRELRARVQKGEKLSEEDQKYYDLGVKEWERQRGKQARTRNNAVRPTRAANNPLAEAPVRKGEEFSVSETLCPLEKIEVTNAAGIKVIGILRKPPGPGPFPALVHLHGTLNSMDLEGLKHWATQPTASRFLAAGYVVLTPTFRDREADPQTRNALVDCLTMIDWVKKRPDVDPASVVVWGDSGGGSLALELAGETDLAAAAAQEPATILMIGILKKANEKGKTMADPKQYWTPELQEFTRNKIRKIHCPLFIAYGDISEINKVNHEIVIPELKAAGKQLETKLYPGQRHGFSKSNVEFYEDCRQFFGKHIRTTPKPISQVTVR
jgi:dienelactone hydrolase